MCFANSIEINEDLRENFSDRKVVFLCPIRWAPTKGVGLLLKAIKLLTETKSTLIF